jgi:hypothetical protein
MPPTMLPTRTLQPTFTPFSTLTVESTSTPGNSSKESVPIATPKLMDTPFTPIPMPTLKYPPPTSTPTGLYTIDVQKEVSILMGNSEYLHSLTRSPQIDDPMWVARVIVSKGILLEKATRLLNSYLFHLR